ncbi:MAG: GntR family transcriptional regulator [Paracoccus sp. (in: a-proteobacteria)]|nr:GntR family transcriptional regulator [Paracoccus sp. (in: a-proteobacteria)]
MPTQNDSTRSRPEGAPRRGSGAAHVYETLKAEIIGLQLAPGSMVDETDLARRFGLSRTPIREAMVRLAAEGLITTLPNRATIVSQIDFLNLAQFFDALTLMYRVTTRTAAANHQPADIPAIRELQAAYEARVSARDVLGMIEVNRDFHLAIAAAGGNPYYTELFGRLLNEGLRILRLYYRSFNDVLPQQYVDEHDAIVAAVIARDLDLADRLAATHASQIVQQIRSYIAAENHSTEGLTL